MAFKEGMTLEEYNADIAEVTNKAKEGLFSEEDVTKRIQSETDKVRTDLHTKKIKPLEEELLKYKPKDKSEAEKELERRLAELETKQKEIDNKEKSMKVQELLTNANMPKDLSKYLSLGDDTETSIKEVVNILTQHLSYKPTNHKKTDNVTKEQFSKMGYKEREKLAEENPELYETLIKS
jgi:hypothetical protein